MTRFQAPRPRQLKTISKIRSAFEALASEYELNEVTVSAICACAKIGRKTFYAYFDSLDSLISHIVEEIVAEFGARISKFADPESFGSVAREFLLLAEEKGIFYERLFCSASYIEHGNEILSRFVRAGLSGATWFRQLSPPARQLAACFILNAGAGVYRQWIKSGKQMPIDELCRYYGQLIGSGISGICNGAQ